MLEVLINDIYNQATAEEAEKVCESIGKNFHLVTFENETEYRKLLPYLRSLGKLISTLNE